MHHVLAQHDELCRKLNESAATPTLQDKRTIFDNIKYVTWKTNREQRHKIFRHLSKMSDLCCRESLTKTKWHQQFEIICIHDFSHRLKMRKTSKNVTTLERNWQSVMKNFGRHDSQQQKTSTVIHIIFRRPHRRWGSVQSSTVLELSFSSRHSLWSRYVFGHYQRFECGRLLSRRNHHFTARKMRTKFHDDSVRRSSRFFIFFLLARHQNSDCSITILQGFFFCRIMRFWGRAFQFLGKLIISWGSKLFTSAAIRREQSSDLHGNIRSITKHVLLLFTNFEHRIFASTILERARNDLHGRKKKRIWYCRSTKSSVRI